MSIIEDVFQKELKIRELEAAYPGCHVIIPDSSMGTNVRPVIIAKIKKRRQKGAENWKPPRVWKRVRG